MNYLREDGTMEITCPYCNGCGEWKEEDPTGWTIVTCSICKGEGYVIDEPTPHLARGCEVK